MPQSPGSFSGDKSREGLTWAKLAQPFRLMRPRNNYALVKVAAFIDIDIGRINDAFGMNIGGVILDVDECLAPNHREILPANIAHVQAMVARGVRAVIFSNAKATDRYAPVMDCVAVHMSRYPKPDPRGFLECCKTLELPPKEVLAIGDNLVTDGGAIRAGIAFALVDPIETPEESVCTRVRRSPQVVFRAVAAAVSDLYDRILDRDVLRLGEDH